MYVKRAKRNFWACSNDKESKLPPLRTGWPWETQGRSLQIKPTWKGVLSAWGCRFLSLSCCLCFGRFLRWRNSSVSFPEPSTESYNQVWWTAWRALKCLWQQIPGCWENTDFRWASLIKCNHRSLLDSSASPFCLPGSQSLPIFGIWTPFKGVYLQHDPLDGSIMASQGANIYLHHHINIIYL